MKKKKIFECIISIMILISVLTSCKKYLEKKPDNSLVVPTSLVDFQALLDNPANTNFVTPVTGESCSDDYFVLGSTFDPWEQRYKDLYTWEAPTQPRYPNDWSFSYKTVYYANLCLEGVEKMTEKGGDGTQWNNVKGSALFFRSFSYLNLVWVHAKAFDENSSSTDLGIVLREGSDFNVPSERASVKKCYEQIISDVMGAAALLPDHPQHVYRPSKTAAFGLLARAYLSMRKYDSAFKYSNLSLSLQSSLLDFNDGSRVNTGNNPLTGTALGNNPEIIFYSQMNSTAFTFMTNRGGLMDTVLFASYETSDRRRSVFFRTAGIYRRFKGSYSANPNIMFSGLTTAEMYLVRAECLARGVNGQLGNKDAALDDLNMLLVNRHNTGSFTPVDAPDANGALDKILQERRKELIVRGLRWIDIKRLNKEGKNIVLKRILPTGEIPELQPNANFYAYPLPMDIIELTGIPQNPL